MRATPNRQALGYATGLTFFTALLAGQMASLSLFDLFPTVGATHLAEDVSGPAPVLAHQFLGLFEGAIAVGYVLIPIAVASYYATRGARHPLFYAVLAIVAILGLPGLRFVVLGLLRGGGTAVRTVVLAGVVVGGLAVVLRVALARGPDDPNERIPATMFVNIGLVVVFLVGTVLGGAVAGDRTARFVETDSTRGPNVFVVTDYELIDDENNVGVLTFRFLDGEAIPAERLTVKGEGFADFQFVDQTGPGPWRGETTSGDTGSVVGPGDSVTIGVAADCTIYLTYQHENTSTMMKGFRCEERRD